MPKKTTLCTVFIFIALFYNLHAQNPIDKFWTPNGTVRTIIKDENNNTVYLGGDFTSLSWNSSSCIVNTNDASLNSSFPKINGIIYTAIADGAGGWFIGGSFSSVGGVARNNLAHIKSDSSLDPLWNPNPNGYVGKMVLNGSTLYIVGAFSTVQGIERNYIAALNVSTAELTSWYPRANARVGVIDVAGSVVYIGGLFTSINGVQRNYVAAINASTGELTSWNPNSSGILRAIRVSGSTVFIGGEFSTVGGIAARGFAAIDATLGTLKSLPVYPNGNVNTIELTATTVYIGGEFTSLGNNSRGHLAAYDINSLSLLSWSPTTDLYVEKILAHEQYLYVGGSFTLVNNTLHAYAVKLDKTSGADYEWNPKANGVVIALAAYNQTLYMGGKFTSMNTIQRNHLAAFNEQTGELTLWNPNVNGPVYSLCFAGTGIIAGGQFSSVGSMSRYNIASFDKIYGNLNNWPSLVNGTVRTVVTDGTRVYVGGSFSQANYSYQRNNLAAFDITSGDVIDWNPSVSGSVASLALSGTNLYIGGAFSSIGNVSRNNIAVINTATGVIDPWAPNISGNVASILASGNSLFVGGTFSSVGTSARQNFASFEISSGNLDTWTIDANSTVSSLAVSGSNLFLGGSFSTFSGLSRRGFAQFDIVQKVATDWGGNSDGTVNSFCISSSYIYVGGSFTKFGNSSVSNFSCFQIPPSIPSAPEAKPATDISISSFTANWQRSPDAAGYKIDVGQDESFSIKIFNNYNIGNTTSYIITNLYSNTTYYFRIRAYNASGSSMSSNIITVKTLIEKPVLSQLEINPLNYAVKQYSMKITDSLNLVSLGGRQITSAQIMISKNYDKIEDLLTMPAVAGIANTWDPNTGCLTLTGSATASSYQSAIKSINYSNAALIPTNENKEISIVVNNAIASSEKATRNIKIKQNNDIPVINKIEKNGLQYIKAVSGFSILISDSLEIADPDNCYLYGATIKITERYIKDEDFLDFTNTSIATGTFDKETGTLRITGKGTVGEYRNYIRTITYRNNLYSAATSSKKTLEFSVNDGLSESVAVWRSLEVKSPLAAPSNISCSVINNIVVIKWKDNTELEDGYIIERKTSSTGQFVEIGRIDKNLVEFSDPNIQNGITYSYRISAYKGLIKSDYSDVIDIVGIIVGLTDRNNIPKDFTVFQNYPNPFNPSTIIEFGLPKECRVVVEVYNSIGQLVQVLMNDVLSPGFHKIHWNAINLTSGVYLCRINAVPTEGNNAYSQIKRMVLLK